MKLQRVDSARVGDSYTVIDHPTGLKIFVYPKEHCTSTFAIFGTKYGSVDTRFRRSDEQDVCSVPEGIAHFLEHKLFENEDCDAFARYAKTGASANAYTSFDATCYLFSTTDNVPESLEILLDFVQSPYFTKETVEKEQGIIGQEIRMYDDDPGWRVLFNLLVAMYHNHPVKIDIAGTVESIAEITPELLYRCYHTFYNLHNMVLVVAGNITVDTVLAVADKTLKYNPKITVEKTFLQEPDTLVEKETTQKLSVAVPLFQIGFKERVTRERKTAQELAALEALLEIFAGEGSVLYRRLLDAALINEATFGYEVFEGPGYCSVLFSGESRDPKAVQAILLEELSALRQRGITQEEFSRAQKAQYGRCVAALNSPEAIGNTMVNLYFAGRELFSSMEDVAQLHLDQVEACLAHCMQEDKCAISTIFPIEGEGNA